MEDLQGAVCKYNQLAPSLSLRQRLDAIEDAFAEENTVAIRFYWNTIVWQMLASKIVLLRPERLLRTSYCIQEGDYNQARYTVRILKRSLLDLEERKKRDFFLGGTERSWQFIESFLPLRSRQFFLPLLQTNHSTTLRWSQGSKIQNSAARVRFLARLLYELTESQRFSSEQALAWLEEPFDGGVTPYQMLSTEWKGYMPPAQLEGFILSQSQARARENFCAPVV